MEEESEETQSGSEEVRTAIAKQIELENRAKSGANWFFWIAGLSVINSLIMLARGDWSFIFGLGATQIVDGFAYGFAEEAPDLKIAVSAIALLANLVVVSIFVLFGVFARKHQTWAFLTGMVLYGLDGLIFLVFADYFSLGFHAFALWGMYGGFQAHQKLMKAKHDPEIEPITPE